MTINAKSRALLIDIAQQWAKQMDRTKDDLYELTDYSKIDKFDTDALTNIAYEIDALYDGLLKHQNELKSILHGAVRMAETVYDRAEIFEILDQTLGTHMLKQTELYDMSQC